MIWVFSDPQQVMVAERGVDAWLTMDWTREIELPDSQLFNIGACLATEDIDPNAG